MGVPDEEPWFADWSNVVGFLICCALIAGVIFIFGTLFYIGFIEI